MIVIGLHTTSQANPLRLRVSCEVLFFFRVMLCISTAYAVAQCLYVRPFDHLSVCLSRSCILSKRINISSNYFTVGWPCHSSFSAPNVVAKFRREPPNGDVECRLKNLFSTSISLHRVLSTLRPSDVINTVPPNRGKLVTLIVGSKWRSLLMAGDDDEVFVPRSLNVTPKTTFSRTQ